MGKMKDIRKKSGKDLEKDLAALRESLRSFRFGIAGSKIRNVKEGHNVKKDIARHLTELKGRKITNNKPQITPVPPALDGATGQANK